MYQTHHRYLPVVILQTPQIQYVQTESIYTSPNLFLLQCAHQLCKCHCIDLLISAQARSLNVMNPPSSSMPYDQLQ